MRILRALFQLPPMNRFLYTRTIMSQLYFPKDSTTDVFVARIPIDEGVSTVSDVDIIIDVDTKSLILVGKRNVPSASSGPQAPLDLTEEEEPQLELIYERGAPISRY